jgi:hypothetical protein
VASDFEEIGTFSRVWNKDPSQEITGVRGDVFGEGERSGDDVLIQKVDVVAIGVGRVVVEGQIAGEHGILNRGMLEPDRRIVKEDFKTLPE